MNNKQQEKFNMNKFLIFIKGLIIGGTMMVPGVSGGTMAMILGIYDRLISSISSFNRNRRDNLLFLAIMATGGILGIYVFSKPIDYLIVEFTVPTMYFFTGAVVGSIPMIYKKSLLNKFSYRGCAYVLIGALTVYAISLIPTDLTSGESNSFLLLVAAGIIAAIALVLPGISVSYLLLVLGIYDDTTAAINEFNFIYICSLGAGLLLGIIVFTRMLDKAMDKYPQPTYLIILGFVIGSLYEIFPGIPSGFQILISVATFVLGVISIYLLTNYSKFVSKLD